MWLVVSSFLAGILTILAPCILPVLPVILSGSFSDERKDYRRALTITVSLIASIFSFSLLLKATTTLLAVPQEVWQLVAGLVVIAYGLSLLVPKLTEQLLSPLYQSSNRQAGRFFNGKSTWSHIVLGASLGSVFNSCSPTYALIVAIILPVSFGQGIIYLAAYCLGLGLSLLLISLLGQQLLAKFASSINFKRFLGVLMLATGLAIATGLDKDIQTYILERGWYNPISNLEKSMN